MANVRGTSGDDSLDGTHGQDKIIGLGGRDWLIGYSDDDVIYGNSGNDNLYGNSGNDELYGGSGRDELHGHDGDDILDPGSNTDYDLIRPGIGNDQVIFSAKANDRASFDIVHNRLETNITFQIDGVANTGTIDKQLLRTTTLSDVGNALQSARLRVIGTAFDDSYTIKLAETDRFQIRDTGGSDTITILNDDGHFTLEYRYAENGVTADLSSGIIKVGPKDVDTVLGAGSVDEFRGSRATDDIKGSAHDETFVLFSGQDRLDGQGGSDTVKYNGEDLPGDVVVDMAKGTATGIWNSAAFEHTLLNIENVYGSHLGNDILRGTNGQNLLAGEAGDDVLIGRGGKDTLWGGDGDDTLKGGKGADVFVFNNTSGADTITDFNATSRKEDIDLSDVTAIKSFNDLWANHLSQEGADVVIDNGSGMTITLLNVDITDLDKSDFLF